MHNTYDLTIFGKGRMSSILQNLLLYTTITYIVVDNYAKIDTTSRCIVDFSHHNNTRLVLKYARKLGIPLLIGTTGQDETEKELIYQTSTAIPIMFESNFSLGIATIKHFLSSINNLSVWQCDIIDYHHSSKADSPSGTALSLAQTISNKTSHKIVYNSRNNDGQIVLHSVRSGTEVGRHDIVLSKEYESIIISHHCQDLRLFCKGAIDCAMWLVNKPPRLYSLTDYLIDNTTT